MGIARDGGGGLSSHKEEENGWGSDSFACNIQLGGGNGCQGNWKFPPPLEP